MRLNNIYMERTTKRNAHKNITANICSVIDNRLFYSLHCLIFSEVIILIEFSSSALDFVKHLSLENTIFKKYY